jgi:arylsulfatase A-like enzyme
MKKPNILWICTDQQRFDSLNCYGNSFVSTPNIDRLADRGVLFESAYCQNPICTPSRSSFLTGRYPRTTRCRQNGQSIPETEVLVTKLFSDAGYACGLSGKLHLSAAHPSVCKNTERRIDDGYDMFHWSHDASPAWPTNEYFHWLNEVDVPFEKKPHPESESIRIGMPAEYHHTTWCVNKAINFIESCSSHDRPWLFSLNIFDPHSPFDPPESYLQKYVDRLDSLPLPNYVEGELEHKPYFQEVEHREGLNSKKAYKVAEMSEKDIKYVKAAYWAMIDLIDDQVGRLMEVLECKGLLDNTMVIFMSDHGELLGDHGMLYKGPFFYEPSVRVPLIVSWPSVIPPGRRSKALVELVDLAQTLLDAAGLPHHPGMQGRSLWKLLKDEADLDHHREDVYCEYYNSLPWNKPAANGTMVVTERYKLVVYHGIDEGELYDLETDPQETVNRWNDPAHMMIQMEMLKKLCDRMAWTVDPLPERTAPW